MIKSIYKITNMVNNKCYIGQTNNIARRFNEHRRMSESADGTSKLLYAAMQKYGLENFKFEILEENIENYNEREVYWINYFNSIKDGYNIAPGGDAPPILMGLDNPNTTHTLEQVNLVKKLLMETELSAQKIGEKTNYDTSAVLRINIGIIWRDEERQYPIRPTLTKSFYHDRALDIISDLLNTKMTQKEIAIKYGVGRSTITAINIGQNNYQPELSYPIRDKKNDRHSKTVIMCDKVTHAPIREFINAEEAANFVKVSRSAIQSCCSGTTKSSGGYFWKYKDK